MVAGFIGSLNTADTLIPAFIPIDQFPGEIDITVGGVRSVACPEKLNNVNAKTSVLNFLSLLHVDFCAITIAWFN
jgi:hypothetical protein